MQKESHPNIKLRVVLIEDSVDVLRLLTEMLNEMPEIEIVASAESEQKGLQVLEQTRPDIAILDLELGAGNGLNVLKTWYGATPSNESVKVVVFSNYANAVIQKRCLSHGAQAFYDKSFQLEEMLDYVYSEAQRKQQSARP